MRLFSAIRATLGTLLLVPLLSGCGQLFVEGPYPGWQQILDRELSDAEIDGLVRTSTCTTSKGVLFLDGMAAAFFGILGVAALEDSDWGQSSSKSEQVGAGMGAVSLGIGGLYAFSALKGNGRVNDCRALNARLFEPRRGSLSSVVSYEWLGELFPLPDLGVTGFDPVFGLPIKQGH